LRRNDLLLLLVLALSISAGILIPEWGRPFQPLLTGCMMGLLFLSFLSIETADVGRTLKRSVRSVVMLSVLKLLVVPVTVYFIFLAVLPSYALAALLLSGISTGVVAPFISNLVGGDSVLVLALVVVTSLLAPFTLPALVKVLASRHMEVPLLPMIRLLVLVVFIPMLAAEALRRFAPRPASAVRQRTFPLSLAFFTAINLGVFSRYAGYFRQEPGQLLLAVGAALLLGGLFLLAGLLLYRHRSPEVQAAAAVSLANMNNVLVIVFASRFFGPLEPTLAAMYMFPFFGLIVPLRLHRRRRALGEGSA